MVALGETLKKWGIRTDAASNGIAGGVIVTDLLKNGMYTSEASVVATFWLLANWLGLLLVNPGNFLEIKSE